MKNWLWLTLIPSLLFAAPPEPQQAPPDSTSLLTTNDVPVEIDVRADSITILTDHTVVTRDELQVMGNPYDLLLAQFMTNRVCPNIQWHTRPGGEDLEKRLRNKADAARAIMGCQHRFSRLFEALEKSEQLDANENARLMIPPKFANRHQNPIYVDVEANQLTIYPEQTVVAARDLTVAGNSFESFLDGVEKNKDSCYIALLLRPGSAVFQRQLRQAIRDRGIDVCFEPWDAGREIVLTPAPESTPSSAEQPVFSNNITVLVATPKEIPGDSKAPVFFECRNQQLFYISLDAVKKACDDKTAELRTLANHDENEYFKSAAQTILEVDGQRIDYTYALLGKYVMLPVPDAKGYPLEDHLKESDEMWFGAKLAALDPENQFICFFVRPDSYPIFQQARAAAQLKKFTVTCELLDEKDPIMLGGSGARILP